MSRLVALIDGSRDYPARLSTPSGVQVTRGSGGGDTPGGIASIPQRYHGMSLGKSARKGQWGSIEGYRRPSHRTEESEAPQGHTVFVLTRATRPLAPR